ncbi:MAG: hypothetical protein KAT90_05515 [Gammaproteobacteria bacterium]|nr:hypothetical protein [Gammaproteobacteria bacterium]
MIKNRSIFASAILLSLIILGILVWRASLMFDNLATMLPETEAEANAKTELNTKTTSHKEAINHNTRPLITDKGNSGHYRTIEETIARLKRNVVVTGTVTGTAGEESALFQIEGMPDRPFIINTQLMDGFIITEITQNQVILKNQSSDDFFSLPVQAANNDESIDSEFLPVAQPMQADTINYDHPPESISDEVRSSEARHDDIRRINRETLESGQTEPVSMNHEYPSESISDEIRSSQARQGEARENFESRQTEPTSVNHEYQPESISDEVRSSESRQQ